MSGGLYARRKGKRGELEVCALLRPACPEVRTKRAGGESASQDRGRDLLGTPGLCVQVHLGHSATPQAKLAEACRASAPGEIPVALTRWSRGGWVATVRAEDLVALLVRLRGTGLCEKMGE